MWQVKIACKPLILSGINENSTNNTEKWHNCITELKIITTINGMFYKSNIFSGFNTFSYIFICIYCFKFFII